MRTGAKLKYGEVAVVNEAQLIFLYREQGRAVEAGRAVRAGSERYEPLAWKAGLACGLCEADGGTHAHHAIPLLEEIDARGLENLPRDTTYPLTLGLLAEAYAYLGDDRRAARLVPHVQACLRRHPVAAGSGTYWGSMHFYEGLLQGTLGNYDEALACFQAAYRCDEAMQAWLWICHTWVVHAQVLRARDRPEVGGRPADRDEATALERRARRWVKAMSYRRVELELEGATPPHLGAAARRS